MMEQKGIEQPTPPAEIAGISLVHISDDPPESLVNPGQPFSQRLAADYERALAAAKDTTIPPDPTGKFDERIARLSLWDGENGPIFDFAVDRQLLARIAEATEAKGAELSQDELLPLALQEADKAVEPDFTSTAQNSINTSYYSSEVAFSPEAGLATMYAENRPLNYAIGRLVADATGAPEHLHVKELCSGSNLEHWQRIAYGMQASGVEQVDVTLSDFTEPATQDWQPTEGVSVSAEAHSLLDDMEPRPADQRFDAMLTTYGFDSVWQPEDIRLNNFEGQWFQTVYRVKVADWNERQDELLEALREGRKLPDAAVRDYDGILVERAMQPIDITDHPFGSYIASDGKTSINFPGGLIKQVAQAFDTQLKPGGVFMSGDTGNFSDQPAFYRDAAISGVAARYRADDYVLAKKILEGEFGLSVELLGLDDLAELYLGPDWTLGATERERAQIQDNPYNGIMVVRRRQPANSDRSSLQTTSQSV